MSHLTAIKSIADIVARMDQRRRDEEARIHVEGQPSEKAAEHGR